MDASACIDTLESPASAARIFAGHDVCAPALLRWEVGNVVHGRGAAVFGDARQRKAIVATLLRPMRLVDQAGREGAIADVARRHALTFYDAAYLQLALDEDAALVTQDKALLHAAGKALGDGRAWTLEDAARGGG